MVGGCGESRREILVRSALFFFAFAQSQSGVGHSGGLQADLQHRRQYLQVHLGLGPCERKASNVFPSLLRILFGNC